MSIVNRQRIIRKKSHGLKKVEQAVFTKRITCVMSSFLFSSLLAFTILPAFDSVGIDIGLCSSNTLACQCGDPGYIVQIPVKHCTFFYKFKPYCRPCDINTGVSKEQMCAKYKNCLDCKPELQSCAACPPNKYGLWCSRECKCQNGGTCSSFDGKCTCRSGFKGTYCEMHAGCAPPAASWPLLESRVPSESPFYIEYSCSDGYKMIGLSRITCLPNQQWSSVPPKCARLCQIPVAPANGMVVPQSGEMISEGQRTEFFCDKGYVLIGTKTLVCAANTTWPPSLPICEKLTLCPDPGQVENGMREVHSLHNLPDFPFAAGTRVIFRCDNGFLRLGAAILICSNDGSWSSTLPSCFKVSPVKVDCSTRGAEVIKEFGVSVRLECPPECSVNVNTVWGTVIYEESSAVCPAAIHSGLIGNTGGTVYVVNSGVNSYFLSSQMNGITSKGLQGASRSFRFHYYNRDENKLTQDQGCPEDWIEMKEGLCALIVPQMLAWERASGVCSNLGASLSVGVEGVVDFDNLTQAMQDKGMKKAWIQILDYNSTIVSNSSSEEEFDEEKCSLLVLEMDSNRLQVTFQQRSCLENFPVICVKSMTDERAKCNDLGPLEHGTAKLHGRYHESGYLVGSAIIYSCEVLHYLKGFSKLTCNSNLTWSGSKPECVRVTTCPEPVSIPFGYVETLPPSKNEVLRRKAVVQQRFNATKQNRKIALPPIGKHENKVDGQETHPNLTIPEGFHAVGSRALYSCHSRYYSLIGSQTRRCQNDGQWSGRVASCIPVCGRSDSPRTPFITNGNATEIGQWPWQTAVSQWLVDYSLWFMVCGGALLNERWVITAAHCVTYSGSTILVPTSELRVHLGKYFRSDEKDDEYVQMRMAKELFVHPDYDPNQYDADIALIELKEAAVLTSRVQPVCLPTLSSTRRNILAGRMGVVTGWGLTENATYGEYLRQALIPVVSDKACQKSYEEVKVLLTITENMFCAGHSNSTTDTCSGDSGGPMVFADDSGSERRWVLEGVVSWGSPNGCGKPNQFGGYTIVSRFLDWINEFI